MSNLIHLLGKKVGMISFFDGENPIPVTVIGVDKHYITGLKTVDKNGYNAVILGTEITKESSLNKPQLENLKKYNLPALKNLFEVRMCDSCDMSKFTVGTDFIPNIEQLLNKFIDIRGVSKGKGFAGVVKKYHFKGQHASHGESLSERSHGSTGQRQDPGKVFKGKKMAGHMGDENMCIHNVQVLNVIADKGLIFLKGSVPGVKMSNIFITNPIKTSSDVKFSTLNGVVSFA